MGITDASGAVVVEPQSGPSFALANFSSVGSGMGTINNWLITPEIFGISNGATFSFYTTTAPDTAYPDRLELRLSSAGGSTNVGTTETGGR